MSLDLHTVDSPIGPLVLGARGDELVALHLPGSSDPVPVGTPRKTKVLAATATQLAEYFARKRTEFVLPLAFGGTEFQRSVWTALLSIPYAATTTYGALAGKLGRPTASRAVGAANGSNPIAIIVPCHRVIGAGGSLTGYGGGLSAKQFLLALEQHTIQPSLF
jgi:methylated-DNA-[protein]-cysteine S-methyltransferase